MLEIVRDRPWVQYHTVLDSEGGPLSDLRDYTIERGGLALCQIREKNATRNSKGQFEHKLVENVLVNFEGELASVIRLSLDRITTKKLAIGDYIIDVVGWNASGQTESLLNPEAIKVVNRPTSISGVYTDVTLEIPDFTQIFEDALNAP